ncbi:MAG: hypothetical protein N3D75_00770 [Candidatus Aenigmarchaeota archaeon]|nr:hypothetical protein [Candidatus Aenigmarchaeota archaeon]
MEEYVYLANIGDFEGINEEKISNFLENEKTKINESVSFMLHKIIVEKKKYPKKVFLIHSEKTKPYAEIIKKKWSRFSDFELVKVNEFDENDIRNKISKIIDGLDYNLEIVYNITNGTKFMSIFCSLEVFSYYFSDRKRKLRIFFVKAERSKKGTLCNYDEMEEVEFNFDKINTFYKMYIQKGIENFNKGIFNEAILNFSFGKNIDNYEISAKAEVFESISRAFMFWDELDYETSLEILKKTEKKIKSDNKLKENVNKKINILSSNDIKIRKIFFIFDLFENYKRKHNIGKNNEAIILLFRSFEKFIEYVLENDYGFSKDTKNFEVFGNKYNDIIKNYANSAFNEKKIEIEDAEKIMKNSMIYLKEMLAIIYTLNHKKLDHFFKKNSEIIRKLVYFRNMNKLIHGGFENKYEVKKLRELLEIFGKEFEKILKEYFDSEYEKYKDVVSLKINISI